MMVMKSFVIGTKTYYVVNFIFVVCDRSFRFEFNIWDLSQGIHWDIFNAFSN
jgi:hypothetical protein